MGLSPKGFFGGLTLRSWSRPALNKARTIWLVLLFLCILPCAEAASISGEVKFTGPLPNHPQIQVTKDQDYCGLTLPNEIYIIGSGRGLKNVVVYIDHPLHTPTPSREDKENLLDNRACSLVPRVMAMRWGERLVVRNNDPKLHIVHSYAEKRTVFNLSLPFRGQRMEITQKIKKPALLQINCDTHGWMRAYIHVFGHPFFAVTDERGSFSIPNIPAGKHTVKAWHEEAGVRSVEVTMPEEGEVRVYFEFGIGASP